MPNNPSESQLIKIWQHQLLDRAGLATEDGEPVEIIYPGRLNDEQGADFWDAVIATSRGLKRGDIEVHVKSSDWWSHQHHQNAVYNRVILHVVMWHNAKTVTKLQNGREVPILALHKYIKTPINQELNSASSLTTLKMPCLEIGQRLNTSALAEFLDRAGEERFLAKAARFRRDLAQMEASESFYQGIMSALGYSRNKLPMLELARRLPLQILGSVTQGGIADEECLVRQQALLLGTAGLLPTQRQDRCQGNRLNDRWVEELEKLWTSFHHTRVMSLDAWHLSKVRPHNSPVRRLVAMSYLLLRYRGKGLVNGLVSLVEESPLSRSYHGLERGLVVTADGYWASHFDFGSGSRIRSPTLLGHGRAADIVVNVLLPFTFAWSQVTSRPELERKAFDLYRLYPKLAINSIERHMAEQLGLSSKLVNSAQWQQGLIHTYNSLCTQGRCNHCSLSQLEAGNYVQS
jgi:hypothetical protein